MKQPRRLRCALVVVVVCVAGCLMVAGVTAQTPTSASAGSTRGGVSTKATPRTADGHPDFSGSWNRGSAGSGPVGTLIPRADGKSVCVFDCPDQRAPINATGGGAAGGPERPKYKPEFQAKVKELDARQIFEDSAFHCMPPGVPRIGPPARIFQTAREVAFLYDDLSGNFFRIIPTDGRTYRTDVDPSYLGDAVGHWEGDTLVVETRNFNTDTWLIDDGAFHTRNLRVTERLRRTGNVIEYQATAYDPEVLAEPWAMKPRQLTLSNQEIVEAAPCIERDANRIPDLSSHDNRR